MGETNSAFFYDSKRSKVKKQILLNDHLRSLRAWQGRESAKDMQHFDVPFATVF